MLRVTCERQGEEVLVLSHKVHYTLWDGGGGKGGGGDAESYLRETRGGVCQSLIGI